MVINWIASADEIIVPPLYFPYLSATIEGSPMKLFASLLHNVDTSIYNTCDVTSNESFF
jgi:hypothetical protein